MEQFLELHEKAVKYDLLKKEYEKAIYHSKAEEVVFAKPVENRKGFIDKEGNICLLEGEKNNGN